MKITTLWMALCFVMATCVWSQDSILERLARLEQKVQQITEENKNLAQQVQGLTQQVQGLTQENKKLTQETVLFHQAMQSWNEQLTKLLQEMKTMVSLKLQQASEENKSVAQQVQSSVTQQVQSLAQETVSFHQAVQSWNERLARLLEETKTSVSVLDQKVQQVTEDNKKIMQDNLALKQQVQNSNEKLDNLIKTPAGFSFARETTYTCNGITRTVKEYRHELTGMEFVLIPGGTFQMGSSDGSSDEKPEHPVTLSPYLISKTEVTQGVWQKIMGSNPSNFKKGDDYPVESVTWEDCQRFCQKTGLQLPTESQWEFAARGGSTGKYYFGDAESELGNYGWYDKNSGSATHSVAQKSPNAYGLYDVAGNVWEWCQDWYADTYSSGYVINPVGPNSGQYRVLRGGSWDFIADYCRSAYRSGDVPGYRISNFGFRCVFQFQ